MIVFLWLQTYGAAQSLQAFTGLWQNPYMTACMSLKANQLYATLVAVAPDKTGKIPKACQYGVCKGQPFVGMSIYKNMVWQVRKQRWEGHIMAAGWNGQWLSSYVYWQDEQHQHIRTVSYWGIFRGTLDWVPVAKENIDPTWRNTLCSNA